MSVFYLGDCTVNHEVRMLHSLHNGHILSPECVAVDDTGVPLYIVTELATSSLLQYLRDLGGRRLGYRRGRKRRDGDGSGRHASKSKKDKKQKAAP